MYTKQFIKINTKLKGKLTYANLFEKSYLSAIQLKIKTIRIIISILYLYVILYGICLTMHKTLVNEYDGTEFRLVQYHMIDCFLFVCLMFIFFPCEYPLHCRDELDNWRDNQLNGEVYIVYINEKGWKLKKDDLIKVSCNVPIIIQHPFCSLENNYSNECINNNEESTDIRRKNNDLIINRILKNCSIGFVNKY